MGVPGDISDPSSRCDTDIFRPFRLRKLDEEKFFFSLLMEGDVERPASASSGSCASRGANGESRGRVSSGLGPTGGDEVRRGMAVGRVLPSKGREDSCPLGGEVSR